MGVGVGGGGGVGVGVGVGVVVVVVLVVVVVVVVVVEIVVEVVVVVVVAVVDVVVVVVVVLPGGLVVRRAVCMIRGVVRAYDSHRSNFHSLVNLGHHKKADTHMYIYIYIFICGTPPFLNATKPLRQKRHNTLDKYNSNSPNLGSMGWVAY